MRQSITIIFLWASLLLAFGSSPAAAADKQVVLVITADASDYILAAGGTIAKMLDAGAEGYLVRVTNDDKDSWNLTPEETARRTRAESEAAARILGFKEVESLGYRAGELGGVSPTELRDRILFYIRLYKPAVMFIPNPYAEYVEVLDRFYAGQAAEDARRAASLSNYQPPFAVVGLETHITPELYYYAQPFDPRRREAESTATFVPQPKVLDIAATFDKKLRAAQALKTINHSTALRIKDRLESTGRRLPLLAEVNEESINQLVEINVRKLAEIAAKDTAHSQAEEFHYAGVEYQIPSKYLQ
ncbi:MAG TPA: PIG-L family deacetylase [Bryobacterales bacterium]|nr:PIG-L family deacetylase [Bryobacterales bacterium]